MSKNSNAFKNGKAFIGFVTAGDPDFDSSLEIMTAMANGGCDLIEIGIPFRPYCRRPCYSRSKFAFPCARHYHR